MSANFCSRSEACIPPSPTSPLSIFLGEIPRPLAGSSRGLFIRPTHHPKAFVTDIFGFTRANDAPSLVWMWPDPSTRLKDCLALLKRVATRSRLCKRRGVTGEGRYVRTCICLALLRISPWDGTWEGPARGLRRMLSDNEVFVCGDGAFAQRKSCDGFVNRETDGVQPMFLVRWTLAPVR